MTEGVAPVSALVLAGGAARRMGGSKTGCRVGGLSLLGRSLALADAVAEQVLLLPGARKLPPEVRGRVIVSDWPVSGGSGGSAGPLAALGAGLEAARHEWCLLLSCDMPWLSARVVRHLVRQAGPSSQPIVAVRGSAGWEPFLALYRRSNVALVKRELEAGRRSLHGLLERADVARVEAESLREIDPELRCLLNVNTPADLDAAQVLASAPQAVPAECAR